MAKAKYKKGADGYYRTKAWDGTYDEYGRKNRIHLCSKKSSADLEKKVNELKAAIKEGTHVLESDETFVEYSRRWLEAYKAVKSTNTRAMYKNIIEKHFYPLESIKVTDIKKIHFQLIINSAADKPRTCQQIKLTFKQVIQAAIDDQLLPKGAKDSICRGVEIPKYISRERRPLTAKEKAAIKTADFSTMERTFVYIIYGCGLRRGEVLALRTIDINLKRAELTVRQSVEFDGNNPSLKEPKTENGRRTVPMPGFLVAHLKEYLPTLHSAFLMHTRDGSMMTKSSYRRMWESIVKKMNFAAGGTESLQVIDGLTAHIFRHNYCSELCYQIPAISTKKIAQLLGDTEKMVIEVYSHILEEKEDAQTVVETAIAL